MAIVPDITCFQLDTGITRNAENLTKALKEYYDSSISDASQATYVGNVIHENHSGGANNGGSSTGPLDSPNFDLVANTNSASSFTVEPQSSETWHMNFRYDSGNDETFMVIDPQGGITDATAVPPTISSTGNPTPSPERRIIDWSNSNLSNDANKYYVVEFDDAAFLLQVQDDEQSLGSGAHFGKIFQPFGDDYGEGFGFSTRSNNDLSLINLNSGEVRAAQFKADSWKSGTNPFDNDNYFKNGWPGNEISVNFLVPLTFNLSTGERHHGFPKYCFRINRQETPGIVVSGNGNTDWVFVEGFSGSTEDKVIPWDDSIRPEFQ